MLLIKKILLIGGVFISSSGILTGTHFSTLEKINSKIKVVPLENSDKGWEKLLTKIKSDEFEARTQIFKTIKLSSKKENSDVIKDLKDSCQKFSQQNYKSAFFEDSDLFSDLKTFCSINLSELLEDGKIFNTENIEKKEDVPSDYSAKAKLMKNFERVKTINSESENGYEIQDKTLLEVKTWDISSDNSWKDLLLWCKKAYSSPYEGDNHESWKNIKNFCQDDRDLEE